MLVARAEARVGLQIARDSLRERWLVGGAHHARGRPCRAMEEIPGLLCA